MEYHIFAPYRVCPVGAHVDHQHGLVTGFAIDKGVDLWFDVTDDGSVHLESRTFPGVVDFNIRQETLVKQGNWGDYTRGAKFALRKRFRLSKGINGVLQGSLPVGGLSSSAAVLIAYVMALAKANGIELTPFEVAVTASQAEREYIGLNNGLLDQACIALGKADHLLMLDCNDNEYRLIPAATGMPRLRIGIFFSGLTRSLVNSDYNLRVMECKTAVWDILAYDDAPLKPMEKTFLRDIPKKKFEEHAERMPQRFRRRAEHFYGEYGRVREAVTAWECGDLGWLGRISNASCESSIYKYECGSPELIAMHEAMGRVDGIYGGRFSGAGFKGACIALMDADKAEAAAATVMERYLQKFPQYKETAKAYVCESADGARFV